MSNADFQDRLQRIGARSSQQHASPESGGGAGKPGRRLNHVQLGIGAVCIALGLQTVKFTNENYETVRDAGGVGTAAALGLAGMAVLTIGIVVLWKAVTGQPQPSSEEHAYGAVQSKRQASLLARIVWSLLGLGLGVVACLYMFMSAAARFIETEKAQAFAGGGIAIALLLTGVALVFGFVSIFVRGYALGRVTAYFLVGGILAFVCVRLLGLNLLSWEPFVAALR